MDIANKRLKQETKKHMSRHAQIMEAMANNPDEVADRLIAWETEVGKTMPADFKDWRENDSSEWPLVTRTVIESMREREKEAWEGAALVSENLKRELVKAQEQRDMLLPFVEQLREWYDGQILDAECQCDDCIFLAKLDVALTAAKE